jgi:hypothetical protein
MHMAMCPSPCGARALRRSRAAPTFMRVWPARQTSSARRPVATSPDSRPTAAPNQATAAFGAQAASAGSASPAPGRRRAARWPRRRFRVALLSTCPAPSSRKCGGACQLWKQACRQASKAARRRLAPFDGLALERRPHASPGGAWCSPATASFGNSGKTASWIQGVYVGAVSRPPRLSRQHAHAQARTRGAHSRSLPCHVHAQPTSAGTGSSLT